MAKLFRAIFAPAWCSVAAVAIVVAAVGCALPRQAVVSKAPAAVPQELGSLWEVYRILEEEYGGKSSMDQRRLGEGAIQGMLDTVKAKGPRAATSQEYDLDAPDLGAVWQAWQDVSDTVRRGGLGITSQQLQEAAIQGMLKALGDPYTAYLPPVQYEMEARSFDSDFEGIGAWVNKEQDKIVIVAPMEGSPAERAGIMAGDVIASVDGVSTTGMSLTEVILKIRGPKGTSVEVTILRTGEVAPRTLSIVRDVVRHASAEWQPLTDDIAYLRITQFLDRTDSEVEVALTDIASGGFNGVVVDLRHNTGGLLSTVTNITSQFLRDGIVVYQVDGRGKRTEYNVRGRGLARDVPVVVLVDGSSASGSEVLAGALQDRGRAVIVGARTYGKGSVNQLKKLQDGSGLYLTFALWYTPNGRMLEGVGLEPDVAIGPQVPPSLFGTDVDQPLKAALVYLESKIASPAG